MFSPTTFLLTRDFRTKDCLFPVRKCFQFHFCFLKPIAANGKNNFLFFGVWPVVVAQKVERSLPSLEVRGSNRVIGKYYAPVPTVNSVEKTKRKRKKAENGQSF